MKVTSVALSAMLSASAFAYPGMGDSLKDFQKRHSHVEKRQSSLPVPPALEAAQSPIAVTIKNILSNADSPELLAPKVGLCVLSITIMS
jgi:hypothetical protein